MRWRALAILLGGLLASLALLSSWPHGEEPVATAQSPVLRRPLPPRVYTANASSNNLSVLDAANPARFLASVALPGATGPAGIALNPDGSRIYVVNRSSANVSVLDATVDPPRFISNLAISGAQAPTGIAMRPDGQRLYVVDPQVNQVFALNLAIEPPTFLGSVALTGAQGAVALTVSPAYSTYPNYPLFVANSGSNNVSVLNAGTDPPTFVQNVALGTEAQGPVAVASNTAGTRLYVANQVSSTIAILDTAISPPQFLRGFALPTGAQGPAALVVNWNDYFLYVANQASSNVSAFALVNTRNGAPLDVPASLGNVGLGGAQGASAIALDLAAVGLYVAAPTSTQVAAFEALPVTGVPFVLGNVGLAEAQGPSAIAVRTSVSGPFFNAPLQVDLSPPLRELTPGPFQPGPSDSREEEAPPGRRRPRSSLGPDPALEVPTGGGQMPPPVVGFDGLTDADSVAVNQNEWYWSADTSGAIGPRHYVQVVNYAFMVYDRQGRRVLPQVLSTADIWQGFANQCQFFESDAIVHHDRHADRWIVIRGIEAQPSFFLCAAVSESADPTGRYRRYIWPVINPPPGYADYEKLGIWPTTDGRHDAYFLSARAGGWAWRSGATALALDRRTMLQGGQAPIVQFVVSGNPQPVHLLPSDLDGPNRPPPDTPNTFFQSLDPNWGFPGWGLQLWEFRVDWPRLQASFAPGALLRPERFDSLPDCSGFCIPQQGVSNLLDPLFGLLMQRFAYRNFGTHESLVVNQGVDAGDNAQQTHVGLRWYELRRQTGSDWSIYQQATHAPDADHRWLGSAAMDGAGNLALAYNVSGPSLFPSIRYAGRLASDPLNHLTLRENTLQQGLAAQQVIIPNRDACFVSNGTNYCPEFGDYTQLSVDPVDDCTLWFVSQYYRMSYPTTAAFPPWSTYIGAFRFPTCVPPTPTPTSTQSPTTTATATPTIHPGTATAVVQTATVQALTATATPTIHPGTVTAIVQTATVQALTATVTPTATATPTIPPGTATIHPLTQTAIVQTATIQALTATATPTATATIHPLTLTAVALTPSVTPTVPVVPPGLNPPPSSGQPGVPAATAVGQVVRVQGAVSGALTVTGSMAYALSATGPPGTVVGGVPAVFLPSTVGVESFACTPVSPVLQTVCTGTTRGNVLQGATITVRFALVGGGIANVTGVATGPGAVATPAAVAAGNPPARAVVQPVVPLLPPPLPPPLLPPPPPPPGPLLVPLGPAPGPPAGAGGVPIVPEADTLVLVGLAILGIGALARLRAGRRRDG